MTEIISARECEASAWIPTNMPADRPQIAHYAQILGSVVHHNIATELGKQVDLTPSPIRFSRTEKAILKRELSLNPNAERFKRDVDTCMDAYRRFIVNWKPKPIWVERKVLSKKHGYAGTLDLMAKVKIAGRVVDGVSKQFVPDPSGRRHDVVTIIDWKTGKTASHNNQLQGTAYWMAADEMGLFAPFRRKKTSAINHQTWTVFLGAERFRMRGGFLLTTNPVNPPEWLEAIRFFGARRIRRRRRPR